ncbi:NAD-dependent succinate-semialdehyde dehydrogenase, partial [Actinoplanes siamensis]
MEAVVETELFIGGKWVAASSGNRFDVLDPATGDTVASVADGGEADAIAAVD